jgi:hypothetical protein
MRRKKQTTNTQLLNPVLKWQFYPGESYNWASNSFWVNTNNNLNCEILNSHGGDYYRPDDGGSTHLWNVHQLQRDYAAHILEDFKFKQFKLI